jgi:hypothetical protein
VEPRRGDHELLPVTYAGRFERLAVTLSSELSGFARFVGLVPDGGYPPVPQPEEMLYGASCGRDVVDCHVVERSFVYPLPKQYYGSLAHRPS